MIDLRPKHLALTLLLAALACLGNEFSLSLAFGVDLIFGPIFVFIAIANLGLTSSLVVALAGGLYTWVMWGHPFAAGVYLIEAAFVFWLSRGRGYSLLSSDAVFWLCLGVPMTALYLSQAIKLPLESASLIALKQFINATFNVLIGSLIVLVIGFFTGKYSGFFLGRQQVKHILFFSMVAITLGAGTAPIIQSGKTDERNTKHLLAAELSGLLSHLATNVELSDEPVSKVLDRFTSRPRIDSSIAFAILDQSGQLLASSGDPWIEKEGSVVGDYSGNQLRFLPPEGDMSLIQALRMGRYEVAGIAGTSDQYRVLVQTSSAQVAERMASHAFNLILLLGVLLLLAIVTSRILSRLLTAPIWRLSTALDSSTNGIVITDLDGKIKWFNNGFRRITGYELEEMKNQKPGELLQGVNTDPEVVERIRQALASNQRFEEDIINYRKDGSPYWVRINCEPLREEGGQITGYIAVETEVTEERKLTELEKFGREALEKLATRDPLGDVFHTVLSNVEAMIPARCLLTFDDPNSVSKTYLPLACYLIVDNGSIKGLLPGRTREAPLINSQNESLGCLRLMFPDEVAETELETELLNRASQLIAIAAERAWSDRRLHETARIFKHVDQGIFLTDTDFMILDVNAAFARITGFRGDEVIGHQLDDFGSILSEPLLNSAVKSSLACVGHWQGETAMVNRQGDNIDLGLNISSVRDERGALQRYIFLISNITELKEYQRQLESMAKYDALTGLPNRVLLGDRLQQAMRRVDREKGRLAVLFIDLDGFKKVNDIWGHEGGDRLLREVTARINEEVRDTDTFARFGGDEFVIVLADLDKNESTDEIVGRILTAVSASVPIGEEKVDVTASVGVTFYPQPENIDGDQLLRQADQAMYAAKQRGRNGFQYFDAANEIAVRNYHEGIGRIEKAMNRRQFELFYQPKVNLKTGEIVGAEALVRWRDPERGLVPPGEFLPIIEYHALSVELGEWVLNTALTQMAHWRKQGVRLPVSVNINSFHLRQTAFAERLGEILSQHPTVPPEDLELEIVETSALGNLESVSDLISECKRLGVVFSLDDFGTGYSSLAYLSRLPVENLKIDMSFVRDMLDDPNDLAIVQGIIGLAESFDLKLIAEGVETAAHSQRLLEIGCDFGQGFGIARPMPSDQVLEWAEWWDRTGHLDLTQVKQNQILPA